MNTSNHTAELTKVINPTYYQVAVLILFLLACCLGNGILIIAIATRRKLRTPSNTYILGLAVCDLIFACCYVVAMDAGINDSWRFGYEMCIANALFMVSMGALSLLHMMVIAVTRYIHVCHSALLTKIDRFRVAISVEIAVWVLGATIVCLPAFFLNQSPDWVVYDTRIRSCSFNRNQRGYSLYLTVTTVIIPTLVCSTSYLKIYLTVRRSKKALEQHQTTANQSQGHQTAANQSQGHQTAANQSQGHQTAANQRQGHQTAANQRQLRQTLSRFLVFLVFILMYLPFSLVSILDEYTKILDEVHMVTALILCANSSVNPVIYGIFNRSLRQAYIDILRCGKHSRNKVTVIRLSDTAL